MVRLVDQLCNCKAIFKGLRNKNHFRTVVAKAAIKHHLMNEVVMESGERTWMNGFENHLMSSMSGSKLELKGESLS